MTKNALLKRGPKTSGMGRPPPPLFGQCPKENVFLLLMSSLSIICSTSQMVYYWNAKNKYTYSQNYILLTRKNSYYVSYFGCKKERSIETKGAYLIFSLFCSSFERYICSRWNSHGVISHTKDSNRIPANKNRPVHKASHLLHPDSFIHISLGDFLALKCLFVSVEATFVYMFCFGCVFMKLQMRRALSIYLVRSESGIGYHLELTGVISWEQPVGCKGIVDD